MASSGGEIAELKEMFASPPRSGGSPGSPPRESALPLTRIAKFGVADENRRLAEQGRMEKEERFRQRETEEAMRLAKAHASKQKAVETNERAKMHREMTREMNSSLVRQIRETEAEWQAEREMAFHGFRDDARKRVLIANALDARLDQQEAAVDAEERRVATMERQELAREVEAVRENNLLEKRDKAVAVRESTTRAVAAAQMDSAAAKKMAAAAKRADSQQWKREKERNEVAQVVRASAGKAAADTTRSNLKKSEEVMTNERKAFVMREKKERMIDYTVAQEKSKILNVNREQVERRYRSKFANATESQQWETIPLRRWYG